MRTTHRIVGRMLVALPLLALLLALGVPTALAGPGQQRSFLAHLASLENAVVAAQTTLDGAGSGLTGRLQAVGAESATLEASAANLTEADRTALDEAGADVAARVEALSDAVAALLADPRLADLVPPSRVADLEAALSAALESLDVVAEVVTPSLVLWNSLGSAEELATSRIGGPGTLTLPGAAFVPGMFGDGVYVPEHRDDATQMLAFTDYLMTPDGTLEFWFKQEAYTTSSGQPDDGRFHSFWSPTIAPSGVLGGYLLNYQVPWEGWHFDISDGTGYVRNTVYPDLAPGQWYHLAYAWSSSADFTEVYLDGVLLNRVEAPLSLPGPVPMPLQFGQDWDSNDRGITSVLDDVVKIWSVARSDFGDRFVG